jgi:RNA polymerase-associated protein
MESLDLNKLTIFTEPGCLYGHQIKLFLHEKDIEAVVFEQPLHQWPEDILAANPYAQGPSLVDRDLILFNHQIITDYIEERYPHPRLFANDPVTRAKQRLIRYRIEHDWYPLVQQLLTATSKQSNQLQQQLIEELTVISPLFESTEFCVYDNFSVIDCALAPLLWHLHQMNAKLPASAVAITRYQHKLFNRRCFQDSLASAEQGLITP